MAKIGVTKSINISTSSDKDCTMKIIKRAASPKPLPSHLERHAISLNKVFTSPDLGEAEAQKERALGENLNACVVEAIVEGRRVFNTHISAKVPSIATTLSRYFGTYAEMRGWMRIMSRDGYYVSEARDHSVGRPMYMAEATLIKRVE